MKYTLDSGKVVNIPDTEIHNFMERHEISEPEAVQLWLEDNDYLDNEELDELDAKAKGVKIQHGAKSTAPTEKKAKPHTVKTSDAKKALFTTILKNLENTYHDSVHILNENKLIECTIDGKIFKIDIIETRKKKTS